MDDIYGDLDNYNDVNAIDELRNENQELKFQIEEYATKMDRLQKDFDKLSSEFKKLEINYSSLLKTAKAEIERKTQIITNLNMEKDMMVLSSIQNSNKSLAALRRKISRDRSTNRKPRKDIDSDLGKGNKKDPPEVVKFEQERERVEDNRLPSIETASSANTDDINKPTNFDNKLGKIESYDKGCERKENILKGKRPMGLKNRRKSMPVLSKQFAKFSTDEDYEDNCSGDATPREWPLRDDKSRKHFDRQKQIHKISETSGIDEKYSSYHESSRETYYKGKSRYSDKYRNARDRYEAQRHKKLYSPERGRRAPRDYPEEQYQRPEFGRYRVLESPPVERYDPQRRFCDRRVNYKQEDPDVEEMKPQQDRLPVKQKAPSDFEIPISKRPRTGSTGTPADKDIRRNIDLQLTSDRQQAHDKKLSGFSDHLSCQSPEYDTVPMISQPVKEIMPTASVKLDDPRLTNKKYLKKIEGDKVILCSATSRNVGLKHIHTSTWDIPKVELPEALRKPPQYSEKLERELHANIDNPALDNSLESGELHSETNDGPTIDYVTKNFLQDYENERNNLQSLGKDQINILERRNDGNIDAGFKTKSEAERCKNSKGEKAKPNDLPNPLGILLEQLHAACGIDKIIKPEESKLDVDKIFGTDEQKTQSCKIAIKKDYINLSRILRSGRKLSAREIVEGDLALSDETTDHTDALKHRKKVKGNEKVLKTEVENKLSQSKSIHKLNKISKKGERDKLSNPVSKYGKTLKSEEKSKPQTYLMQDEDKTFKTQSKAKQLKPDVKITQEIGKAPKEVVPKNPFPDNKNTKNTRKKSDEQKETSREVKVPENKTRPKKIKETKTTAKFSDLFGDSSSLISPEDLGLTMTQVESEPLKKYVPIFEDAQDANDVNVNIMKDSQTQPSRPPETSQEIAKPVQITEDKPKNTNELSVDVDTKKYDSDEVCNSVPEATPNIKNVDTKVIKEPDVVKTVIISTGVQPQLGKIEPHLNNNEVEKVDNTKQSDVTIESKNVPLLVLATSTPYKKHTLLEMDIDSSSTSSGLVTNNALSVDQSSVSNGLNTQNDADVPDVRIFVKRRRKPKK